VKLRALSMIALATGVVISACGGPPDSATPTGIAPRGPVSREQALADFELVRSVLQHPRCQNCHPGGDAPLQGDQGALHTQGVLRGPEGKGMPGAECTTCHGPANPPASYGTHIPPGVSTGWHMPAPGNKLVFVGVAPSALCEQVKDPIKNGGMTTKKLEDHIHDPLVLWAWSPGPGRTALPVDQPAFERAWNEWLQAGSPCPAR
jgi:hypothetical protein